MQIQLIKLVVNEFIRKINFQIKQSIFQIKNKIQFTRSARNYFPKNLKIHVLTEVVKFIALKTI